MRIVVPGHPHHVILRGNNRRRLFSYPSEYRRFLWDLRHALRDSPCVIHAIALMPNHVHLIIWTPDGPSLSKLIQRTSQRYAQVRNRRRGATGKLFEQRYLSIPILTEHQLAITTAYVELNPVRAGLVDHPADWPWTTYGLHTGGESNIPLSMWRPSDWYLDLGRSFEERVSAYTAWVRESQERGEAPERVEKIQIIEALSSERYTRRLLRPNGSSAR